MGSLSIGEGWRSGYHPSDNNSNPLLNEMSNPRSVLRAAGQEKGWSSCQAVLCPSLQKNMLPKEGMDVASLKVFKVRLVGQHKLVCGNQTKAGGWNLVGFKVLSYLSHSMISYEKCSFLDQSFVLGKTDPVWWFPKYQRAEVKTITVQKVTLPMQVLKWLNFLQTYLLTLKSESLDIYNPYSPKNRNKEGGKVILTPCHPWRSALGEGRDSDNISFQVFIHCRASQQQALKGGMDIRDVNAGQVEGEHGNNHYMRQGEME